MVQHIFSLVEVHQLKKRNLKKVKNMSYICKCGHRTAGRMAKCHMVTHIIHNHGVEGPREGEKYVDWTARYGEWIV